MWRLFGKLLHPCAVQLVKTSLLSSKRGHFDLVYCSVLKPRLVTPDITGHALAPLLLLAAQAAPAASQSPRGNEHHSTARTVAVAFVPTMHTRDHREMPQFSDHSYRKAKTSMGHQTVSPYPVLPVLFPPKRLASSFTSAILARIPVQSFTKGLASLPSACSSPQTFLIKIKFLQY